MNETIKKYQRRDLILFLHNLGYQCKKTNFDYEMLCDVVLVHFELFHLKNEVQS